MGIFKRGKIWYIDFYVEGRRMREAVGPSRKMAESVLAKRKVQVTEKRYLEIQRRPNVTFEECGVQYMEYAKSNKRSWRRDERSIRILSRWFLGKRLFEITPLDLEKFKTARSKQVSPASVNRELACLKHMFTKAIEWNMAVDNPVKKVKMFRENAGRVRYLSKAEAQRLLDECAEHLRPIVIVALYTGMRLGEILNLKWEDVDFDLKTIYIHTAKSGYGRDIPMAEPVFFALKRMPRKAEYVFCRDDGTRMIDIRTAFNNAVKRAEIEDFKFHDLRHTFASHLVMNGTDLMTVKELLGHRTINMTLRYAHLSPEHKRKAVDTLGYFDGHNMVTKADTEIAKDT